MTLAQAFRTQSAACAALGSPFMARLMRLAADRLDSGGPVGRRLAAWDGDPGPSGASLPLRLAGALHALALRGEARLAAVYPPAAADDEALWQAVAAVLADRHATVLDWLERPPQTNEVRRSAALFAAAHWLDARFGLPLRLSELGASAGLNLMFDRFALQAGGRRLGPGDAALELRPEWRGAPPPVAAPVVVDRRGVDLRPVDVRSGEGQLCLRAYLWPDQPERRALTDAAIAVAEAPVDAGDAVAWLGPRLAAARGTLHVVYHTIAWQYFPPPAQAAGEALFEQAGRAATAAAPLARLSVEADAGGPGAAVTLQVGPDGAVIPLGRMDFHGRWLDWRAPVP